MSFVLVLGCPAPGDDATGGGTSSADSNGNDVGGTGSATTGADSSPTSDGGSGADGSTGVATCDPTEDSIRAAIFEPKCAIPACHDSQTMSGGLDLSAPDLAGTLAGRASGTCDGEILIVAGDASTSFLSEKLRPNPSCGLTMPSGSMALSDDEIGCIDAWIGQLGTTCETCGGSTCVDFDSSTAHCGGCNQPCPDGVACVGGVCDCPGTTELCNRACVDTQSSPDNCGGCGMGCTPVQVCLNGGCTSDCGTLTECSGACVDLQSDPLNCGGCDAPCGSGETCSSGSCECNATPLSYAADIESFIVSTCAKQGCHKPMGPTGGAQGLDLSAGVGYGSLVNVPSTECSGEMLVEPGSPSNSYVYNKVLGVNLCSGSKMPKTGAGLSASQLQAVSNWICSGAAM